MTNPLSMFGRPTARTASRFFCVLLAAAPFVLACEAETGPDAPPRKNGCIDLECPPVATATPTPTSGDAGSSDGG